MGIDVHGLNFLRYCKAKKDFGRVLTVGRQHIHIRNKEKIQRIMQVGFLNIDLYFCEELLERYFGAKSISSIDASDREKPTFIHDLNEAIPLTLEGQFDTLLDFGTSEHIFDVAQAFRNYSKMVEEGGQIIHVLPADNFNGHGFWQFSPEFFYSLYARHNGFEDTEVYVADTSDERYWYKVTQPIDGARVIFSTVNPTYVLVRTVRKKITLKTTVQQSDYLFAWENFRSGASMEAVKSPLNKRLGSLKQLIARSFFMGRMIRMMYKTYKELTGNRFPTLTKVSVSDLIL